MLWQVIMGKINEVYRNPNGSFDIVFGRANDQNYIDSIEEIKLYNSVERIATTINNLKYTDKEIKEQFFEKLVGIAQVGFIGENASVEFALAGIENLKNEMLENEGGRIKNKYHLDLGLCSLIALAILWGIYWFLSSRFNDLDTSYFIVFTGALIGQWLSFGARKMNLEFENLSTIEQDKMSKPIRIIFILLSSFILFVILTSGAIDFKFGEFSSDNLDHWKNQIILGCVAGLLDSKLGLKLYEKATEITK